MSMNPRARLWHSTNSTLAGRALLAGAIAATFATVFAAPTTADAQAAGQVDPAEVDMWDVIQTTDGNVLKGVIVEQARTAAGTMYKIVLPAGGGTLTIPEGKVQRITKERNPARAQPAAAAYPAPPQAAAAYPQGTAPTAPQPAAPGYGQPPAAGYPVAGAAAQYGAAPAQPHHIDLPPPVATQGMRLGLQFGPYFPMGDLAGSGPGSTNVGFGGRIRFGYEFMFDRFGITPSIALETAFFSTQSVPLTDGSNADGGVFYFGVQPGITAAVHMGMFAPYFGLTFGFDHYAGTGKIADIASANNVKTDANGFGFGVLFGLDLVFNPSVSAGIGGEIHPGFTTLDPGNGLPAQDLGHAALLFEGKYHF
jgi:hypothetical protein